MNTNCFSPPLYRVHSPLGVSQSCKIIPNISHSTLKTYKHNTLIKYTPVNLGHRYCVITNIDTAQLVHGVSQLK